MTTQQIQPAGLRVVPDWELCDRMRRSLRLVPDLDGSAVADRMGVRRETVSTWLSGRRRPSNAVLTLWSEMTGVDRAWLVTGQPSSGWYAIRDSNPEPADLERPRLRLLGGRRIEPVPTKPRLTLVRSVA